MVIHTAYFGSTEGSNFNKFLFSQLFCYKVTIYFFDNTISKYEHCISCVIDVSYVIFIVRWIIIITTIIEIIIITIIIRIKIIFELLTFLFNSAVSIISFILIWRNTVVFLIIPILIFVIVIVTIIVIVDIIRIIIRNTSVIVIEVLQLLKLLLDIFLWLLLLLELFTGVIVVAIRVVIRYIVIVGTSRVAVRIFTKAIIVIIRIITSGMVMMI